MSRLLYIPATIKISDVSFGLLYNFAAISDSRGLASSGYHVITQAEYNTIATYLGGLAGAGAKMKATELTFWTDVTDNTNESGFNSRGAGYRLRSGPFSSFKQYNILLTATSYATDWARYFVTRITENALLTEQQFAGLNKKGGASVRVVKNTTTLSNGEKGTYTDPSGYVYETICIGGIEVTINHIKTRHFANLDEIPYHGSNADYYTNAEWAALSGPGCCPPNGNWSNV